MIEDIAEMQRLLTEVAEDVKRGRRSIRRATIAKLRRIAAIAETLAVTLEVGRCR